MHKPHAGKITGMRVTGPSSRTVRFAPNGLWSSPIGSHTHTTLHAAKNALLEVFVNRNASIYTSMYVGNLHSQGVARFCGTGSHNGPFSGILSVRSHSNLRQHGNTHPWEIMTLFIRRDSLLLSIFILLYTTSITCCCTYCWM